MRGLFTSFFLLVTFVLNGQIKRDERKLTFLLDKEVDSLCIDCRYQDCEVLLYNAHQFENLRSLLIKYLDKNSALKNIKYFRRLKKLELYEPEEFDFLKEIIKVKKVLKLRELKISSSKKIKLYTSGLSYYHRRKFFKNLYFLRKLELRNIDVGLASDIKMLNKLKFLRELKITGVGVTLNHFEKLDKKRYKVLEVDEHYGYLNYKINFNVHSNNKRYWERKTFRYRSLTLLPSTEQGLSTDLIPLQHKYYFGNPKNEFVRNFAFNSLYKEWFTYYLPRKEDVKKAEEALKVNESDRFQYFGKLKTGSSDEKFYSFGYKKFEFYKRSYDFYKWDTLKSWDRLYNINYSNGSLVPIQWNKKNSGKYLRKKVGKEWVEVFQNTYEFEFLENNLLQLKAVQKENEAVLGYKPCKNFKELNALKKYAFSIKDYSSSMTRKLLKNYILDAWFTYDDSLNSYLLNIKNSIGIRGYPIQWWRINGDFREANFETAFKKYLDFQDEKFKRLDHNSLKEKTKLMRKAKFDPSFNGFKTTDYLSSVEKGMTARYWLSYVDRINKNEKDFLLNANVDQVNIDYMLQKQGFNNLSLYKWCNQYIGIKLLHSPFKFNDNWQPSNNARIIVLDGITKSYTSFTMSKDLVNYTNNEIKRLDRFYFYLPIMSMNKTRIFIVDGNKLGIVRKVSLDETIPLEVELLPGDLINYRVVFKMLE